MAPPGVLAGSPAPAETPPECAKRWVMRRTAVANQIRGLLLERGITLRKGRCHPDAALPGILEDATAKLSGAVRLLLAQLKLELDQLAIRIDEADALIQKAAEESEVCRRLDAIPGIGPLTATALIAAIGNGAAFRKGRVFAAWVGLVPREHSTGGKQKLLRISKRGNCYLRTLFRARCTRCIAIQRETIFRPQCMAGRSYLGTHYNVAGAALANKLARMAWRCSPQAKSIGHPYWPADDAWLTPGLEIASAIPTSPAQLRLGIMISCQVCWRTMRWHNGRTRRPRNPNRKKSSKTA